MLEERRVRELLSGVDPLNHHHLLQLQQLQQQAAAAQQHQSHHHRGDRDHHHHHRERGDRDRERERDVRERQYHHLTQHRERGDRDRDRERERERVERHQEQLLQQLQAHQQQQQNAVREREREQRERERERERERDRDREREREKGHRDGRDDESKQFDCGALPKGWVREEIVRKTGLSAGKIDVCYHSPNGKKFWSKPQMSRFLGDSVDLSTFDFRTGKVHNLLLRKNKKHRPHTDYSRGVRSDTTLLPPIRQTASIFKQPVTVHKTQKLSTVKVDFKHGHQEKPKQLFWEKRLEGLRSCDPSGVPLDALDLPRGVEPVGPNIHADTVLQSVATALHMNGQPITGQTMPRPNLETNPGVYINPDQPLIQAVNVRDDDINKQEERVLAARKKLEEALKAYDMS